MDNRTPAEIKYDSIRDGSAYAKPVTEYERGRDAGRELVELMQQDADDAAICAWIDKYLPDDEEDEGPIGLQITRHTTDADGTPADDPWTTFKFGEAEIDIHDTGGGNLCLPGLCHDFQDVAALFDLAVLLSNAAVQETLGRADDTYTPCSPAWEAVLDIVTGPK